MMILDLRITHYAQVVANFTQGSYLYWDYILNCKLMFYCYRYISNDKIKPLICFGLSKNFYQ